MSIPYIYGRNAITVYIDGVTYTVPSSAPNFADLKDAVKNILNRTVEDFKKILNIRAYIAQITEGRAEIVEGKLYFDGKPMNGAIAERVAEMFAEGFGLTPLLKFLNRVAANPRLNPESPIYLKDFENQLYLFLASGSCPITEEGKILAYKLVRNDFMDIYSGTFYNAPGEVVQLKGGPDDVNPDRLATCARGLHFASLEYVKNGNYGGIYGGRRMVVVELDPADIIAIPYDYNNSKGRAWRYTVLRELQVEETIKDNFISNDRVDSWAEPEDWADDDDVDDDDDIDFDDDEECDVSGDDSEAEVTQSAFQIAKPKVDNLLTDDEVREIRKHLSTKQSIAAIGRLYGVSARTISRIRDDGWENVYIEDIPHGVFYETNYLSNCTISSFCSSSSKTIDRYKSSRCY